MVTDVDLPHSSSASEIVGVIQRIGFNLGKVESRTNHHADELNSLHVQCTSMGSKVAVLESQMLESRQLLTEVHSDLFAQKNVVDNIQRMMQRTNDASEAMLVALNSHVREETEQYQRQSDRISKLNIDNSHSMDLLASRLIKVFIAISALTVIFSSGMQSESLLNLLKVLLGN